MNEKNRKLVLKAYSNRPDFVCYMCRTCVVCVCFFFGRFRTARWYRDNGVTILSWCECYEVDVAASTMKLYQVQQFSPPARAPSLLIGCLRNSFLVVPLVSV